MPGRGQFLFVTWNGGGNLPPAIGLGRMLAERGHDVRIAGWETSPKRIRAAGCRVVPMPDGLRPDPAAGRAFEDMPEEFLDELFCGTYFANVLLAEVDREPADVLVVDYMLGGAMVAAERTGLATVAIVHTVRPYFCFPKDQDPEFWGWGFDPTNETRAQIGLEPIAAADKRIDEVLVDRVALAISVLPREFDAGASTAGENWRYVGPVFEEASPGTADMPWAPDDERPLVVVGLSTTYMHQEAILERVLSVTEGMDVRVLVTLGDGLELDEVAQHPNAAVRRYVPHLAVLPQASAVITHAGMGTVMAAASCGTPMLCMPLDRDQPLNAERVAALGAGLKIDKDSPEDAIAEALAEVLGSPAIRQGAKDFSEVVDGYGSGAMAVEELESLLG